MSFNNISSKTAYSLIEKNKNNPDFILIDVRTPKEFNRGHIENAKNIDFYKKDFKKKINALDKNKEYFLYCRSGERSLETMKLMHELGFNEVHNLAEGIIEWQDEGFELV